MKVTNLFILLLLMFFSMMLQADFITEMEEKIHQIYQDVSPNVVTINVVLKESIDAWRGEIKEVTGCGLILNEENYIVTNYHVSDKDNVDSIKVILSGSDEELEAVLVGSDEMNDMVLLQVENLPLQSQPLKWADINYVKAGQFVIAIGDPLGLKKTVTFGMISQVQRDLLTYELNPFIQSDIRINNGNSGGPLINMKGEIIGINSQMDDFAFSVPVDVVQKSIEKMKKGDVKKPYFGLKLQRLVEEHRKFFQHDSLNGVIFYDYNFKSPAKDSGLQPGDIIIGINDEMITGDIEKSIVYYRRLVNQCEIGSNTTLTVWRFGEIKKIKFEVIEEPQRMIQKGFHCDNWGFILKEFTEKLHFKSKNDYKVPIRVGQLYIESFPGNKPNRELERSEVIVGIVVDNSIIEINNLADLEEVYKNHKEDEFVMFKVISQDVVYYSTIEKLDRSLESLED